MVKSTPGGKWFHYPLRDLRLTAHVGSAGDTGVNVLWKGEAPVNDLGAFFEHAANQIHASQAGYNVVILDRTGPQPFKVAHVVPIPEELLASAQFIRFECQPETEAGETPLIVWVNLDREVDPGQESIGVYLRQWDLPKLSEEISRIVVRTTAGPDVAAVVIGTREDEVKGALANLASDIKEAALQPPP